MGEIKQLWVEPHHFLKSYFGERYVVLNLQDDGTLQYCLGRLTNQELAYLASVLKIISDRQTQGEEV